MGERIIECLQCGKTRTSEGRPECPRCGYLGWAEPHALTERMRRSLRSHRPELRRVRPV
jgi:hypothetical protein